MPWKETSVLDERSSLVLECLKGEESKAALCRRYGVSRPTANKWIARFLAEGRAGLEDRTRAPEHHPNRVPWPLVEAMLLARQVHPHWGPRKLRAWLQRQEPEVVWPAASTFGDELRRRGLTRSRGRARRVEPYTEPFADCLGPNDVWSVDYKGWFRTGDGRRCDPLTVSDNWSRYLLGCRAVAKTDYDHACPVLEWLFREYGLPRAIRSDNGPPFASCGLSGLSRLSVWWLKLGIVPERIAPASPQENGRHERLHRTLKEATANPPQETLRAQQRAFDRFRGEYNEERPHESLGQRVPGEVYVRSPREYPRRVLSPQYRADWASRRVRGNGTIKWQGSEVFLSETLCGEPVGLEAVDERYWTVYFANWALGVLDGHEERVLTRRELAAAGLRQEALGRPFRYAPGSAESFLPGPEV